MQLKHLIVLVSSLMLFFLYEPFSSVLLGNPFSSALPRGSF